MEDHLHFGEHFNVCRSFQHHLRTRMKTQGRHPFLEHKSTRTEFPTLDRRLITLPTCKFTRENRSHAFSWGISKANYRN